MAEELETTSAWTPFGVAIFRDLWLATVVSNIGTWMQNVGAAWLMTSLSPSPLMVALVQAATTLPMFVLALPAGALADIVDRRRLLLATQTWMLLVAGVLGGLTMWGLTTPWVLLALTFSLGLGSAMNAPAWMALVVELVPRRELPKAIALNSAGFNLARAVGPAAGGAIVAAAGVGPTFLLNAVSFLGVVLVLYWWRKEASPAALPAERMVAAMYTGLRYVRHAPELRAVFWRAALFMAASSALWALLPLVARYEVGGGPTAYGILLGCLGAGAVAGAAALPRLTALLPGEALVAAATLLFAAMTVVLALVPNLAALSAAMFLSGTAWLALVSSFNVAVQTSVPSWIRARALAVYMVIFSGTLGGGAALWGAVAKSQGLRATLLYSALAVALSLLAMLRYRLKIQEDLDLSPSLHWPTPLVAAEPQPEVGPILVMIEYRIDPKKARPFAQAMRGLALIRRRDGAIRWGLFEDMAEPGRYLETFVVETWAEHLRQHERMTVADRAVEDRVMAFHRGELPPRVSHLIYVYGHRGRERRRFLRKLSL